MSGRENSRGLSQEEQAQPQILSRREFLKNAGKTVGGVLIGTTGMADFFISIAERYVVNNVELQIDETQVPKKLQIQPANESPTRLVADTVTIGTGIKLLNDSATKTIRGFGELIKSKPKD